MSVEIREAKSRAERKAWVKFVFEHYRGHRFYVPQILSDEIAYFDPRKNPAFDVADVRMFMAWKEGTQVGRVCGIINRLETEKLGRKIGRFGWFESIDDHGVAHRLLDRVRDWLKTEGCGEMTGPHGFTDLDPSGVLIDGFDLVPTISGSYHYPYYSGLLESWGLEKHVDYIEFRIDVTKPVPFLERIRDRIDDGRYSVVSLRSRKALLAQADTVWRILEESYTHLYGVIPLTEAQVLFYTKKYLSFLDPDFVKHAYNATGDPVGFLIAIPNLSQAFQRAGGRLFPFGLVHILRAYRKPDAVDLLLVGARREAATKTVTALGLLRMHDTLRKRGVRFMETNRQLETNTSVHRIWRKFDVVATRRTRIYRIALAGMHREAPDRYSPTEVV